MRSFLNEEEHLSSSHPRTEIKSEMPRQERHVMQVVGQAGWRTVGAAGTLKGSPLSDAVQECRFTIAEY